MLKDHCCPKAHHWKSSSGCHCNGLYIQQNPKWEVSGANPWLHWCELFGNGLRIHAHGHHFLMDLTDGKANTVSFSVQSLAVLMQTFRKKPWGGFDPLADLIRLDSLCNETKKRKSQGGSPLAILAWT